MATDTEGTPAMITEYRKDNLWLVVEREEADRYFWQVQEGARKRTPVASGIADAEYIGQMTRGWTEVR